MTSKIQRYFKSKITLQDLTAVLKILRKTIAKFKRLTNIKLQIKFCFEKRTKLKCPIVTSVINIQNNISNPGPSFNYITKSEGHFPELID